MIRALGSIAIRLDARATAAITLILVSGVATASANNKALETCLEFLINHLGDASYETACIETMEADLNLETSPADIPAFELLSHFEAAPGSFVCTPNVNMSRIAQSQNEIAIVANPSQPSEIFAFSNSDPLGTGLFAARSVNAGATWLPLGGIDSLIADGEEDWVGFPIGHADPSAAWDGFGNLFRTYIGASFPTAPLLLSQDGGQGAPTVLHTFGSPSADRPTVATAAGSVWIVYVDLSGGGIFASGAAVTGSGNVSPFSTPQTAPALPTARVLDIAISPTGQVLIAYQNAANTQPANVVVARDADGLGPGGFGAAVSVALSNVNHLVDSIPAQPLGITALGGIAYDHSDGPYRGRAYIVYVDETDDESDDTDVFVRFSTNDGVNWSDPVRVNDGTMRSQFLPRLAIDPSSGHVAVSWRDARHDAGSGPPHDHDGFENTDAEMFASMSLDGGVTFLPNVQVSAGASNQTQGLSSRDYGDYTGLAFEGGMFHPAWADNSNSTLDNPGVPAPTIPPTDPVPRTTNDAYTATCGLDSDGDGVMDAKDNCLLFANAPPLDCDTDEDGYGNACDGDFDQSNSVNATDFSARFLPDFKVGFDQVPLDGTDMNCSGNVNVTDFSVHFLPSFGVGKPGPSGLACAGMTPCPDL